MKNLRIKWKIKTRNKKKWRLKKLKRVKRNDWLLMINFNSNYSNWYMIGSSREDDLLNKLKNCVGGIATKTSNSQAMKSNTYVHP